MLPSTVNMEHSYFIIGCPDQSEINDVVHSSYSISDCSGQSETALVDMLN